MLYMFKTFAPLLSGLASYIGQTAVQSDLRAQRFPLFSLPKETSRWEKVRRR